MRTTIDSLTCQLVAAHIRAIRAENAERSARRLARRLAVALWLALVAAMVAGAVGWTLAQ